MRKARAVYYISYLVMDGMEDLARGLEPDISITKWRAGDALWDVGEGEWGAVERHLGRGGCWE